MRQSLVVAVIALVLFGVPARSEAGLGDLIWELSGPQMVGAGVTCRLHKGKVEYCEWSAGLGGALRYGKPAPPPPPWFWSLGGAGYVSTGKNSHYEDNLSCPGAEPCVGDEIDYHDFDHWMLSFEPTADYRVASSSSAALFFTAGPTMHTVWNRDAEHFHKWGFKFAPEVRFKNVAFSYNLRFYADGFGADEFGKGVFRGGDRPSEWTHGFGVAFPFKRR